MLVNLSIGKKLGIGFGIVIISLIFIAVLGVIAFFQIQSLKDENVLTTIKTICLLITGVALSTILIGFPLAISISKSIRRSAMELKSVLGTLNKGDFTVDINVYCRDELGDACQILQEIILKRRKFFAESKRISDSLASSSEELSATTEEISRN
ncbi:MAG: hypothetical protein ACP5O9_03375, partial [Thermodesulfovibrio sp.]